MPHRVNEGLSDYLEPIARCRVGNLSPRDVWKGFLEGIPKGMPGPDHAGLDHDPSWGRVYWGGTLFWLVADLRVRERTPGAPRANTRSTTRFARFCAPGAMDHSDGSLLTSTNGNPALKIEVAGPRPVASAPYPLVLQPPLPLQEFFPLQPLSLELQPPWPLHEFFPAQSCLADAAVAVPPASLDTPALPAGLLL